MRRDRGYGYAPSYTNQYQNPGGYQSMFVAPVDLGLIQQYNQDYQKRYDAAVNAEAQARGALYDMEFYDPVEKKRIIDAVESRFGNLYKEYSGDMGAATGDLMNLIGSIRKDEAFDINKYALEQQKKVDALKQAHGANKLVFRDIKPGLRREDGSLKTREDFSFDILGDLKRDEKLAQIIDQSLANVSKEGELRRSGAPAGYMRSKTEWGKGMDQEYKAESIYQEYLDSPEGQLHLRILNEGVNGAQGIGNEAKAKTAIKAYVDTMIKNRMTPVSSKYDYQRDLSYDADRNKADNNGQSLLIPTALYETISKQTQKPNTTRLFSSDKSISDAYNSDKVPDIVKETANTFVNQFKSSQKGISLLGMIRNSMVRNGIDPSKYLQGAYIPDPSIPIDDPEEVNDDLKSGSTPIGSSFNLSKPFRQPSTTLKGSALEQKALYSYINEYNTLLRQHLSDKVQTGYANFDWRDLDPSKAYEIPGLTQKQIDAEYRRVENLRNDFKKAGAELVPQDLNFEVGPLSDKNGEFSKEDLKNWDVKDIKYGLTPDQFSVLITTKDNQEHIATLKSVDAAIRLARKTNNEDAKRVAASSGLRFVTGSDSFWKLVNGNFEKQQLPKGITVEDVGEGYYKVFKNGVPLSDIDPQDGKRKPVYLSKYRLADELNLFNK